jgi:hypothetical protein
VRGTAALARHLAGSPGVEHGERTLFDDVEQVVVPRRVDRDPLRVARGVGAADLHHPLLALGALLRTWWVALDQRVGDL